VRHVSHDNPQPQHHRVRACLRLSILNRSNPTRSNTPPLQYFLSTSHFLHCIFIVSQLNCRPSLLLPMTRDFSTLAGTAGHELQQPPPCRQAKAASSTTAEWVTSKFRVLILEAALCPALCRPSPIMVPGDVCHLLSGILGHAPPPVGCGARGG
jgi:hypothetical protein